MLKDVSKTLDTSRAMSIKMLDLPKPKQETRYKYKRWRTKMSNNKERFSVSFSQDKEVTRVSISLPTEATKKAMQKAILLLTGGSVFWISSILPISLPHKSVPPSESRPTSTWVQPPSV